MALILMAIMGRYNINDLAVYAWAEFRCPRAG